MRLLLPRHPCQVPRSAIHNPHFKTACPPLCDCEDRQIQYWAGRSGAGLPASQPACLPRRRERERVAGSSHLLCPGKQAWWCVQGIILTTPSQLSLPWSYLSSPPPAPASTTTGRKTRTRTRPHTRMNAQNKTSLLNSRHTLPGRISPPCSGTRTSSAGLHRGHVVCLSVYQSH